MTANHRLRISEKATPQPVWVTQQIELSTTQRSITDREPVITGSELKIADWMLGVQAPIT
jgi:hypothetical protein